MGDALGIFALIAIIVAFVLGIVGCVFVGAYHVSKSRCAAFERATSRETKFVRYNSVTWECLTPAANGKWIPITQLREFGE